MPPPRAPANDYGHTCTTLSAESVLSESSARARHHLQPCPGISSSHVQQTGVQMRARLSSYLAPLKPPGAEPCRAHSCAPSGAPWLAAPGGSCGTARQPGSGGVAGATSTGQL
eukprot:1862271-Lingulodinium_polyedra.AAC.1